MLTNLFVKTSMKPDPDWTQATTAKGSGTSFNEKWRIFRITIEGLFLAEFGLLETGEVKNPLETLLPSRLSSPFCKSGISVWLQQIASPLYEVLLCAVMIKSLSQWSVGPFFNTKFLSMVHAWFSINTLFIVQTKMHCTLF